MQASGQVRGLETLRSTGLGAPLRRSGRLRERPAEKPSSSLQLSHYTNRAVATRRCGEDNSITWIPCECVGGHVRLCVWSNGRQDTRFWMIRFPEASVYDVFNDTGCVKTAAPNSDQWTITKVVVLINLGYHLRMLRGPGKSHDIPQGGLAGLRN